MTNFTYTYNNICLYSFNSRGFGDDKQEICKMLTTKNNSNLPILCNQENFLLLNNRYKIKQCLPDFHIYVKPAVMDSLYGRPRNSMFIAVPMEIKENVRDISPTHWRIQAIIINTLASRILVINSYFPTDPKIKDFDMSDLLGTLDAIKELVITTQFDHLVWAGDLNADFTRCTKFTTALDQFIDERCLTRSWHMFHANYTHVIDIEGKTFTSLIDHFHWSIGIDNCVEDAGVLYLPQNTSDHCPIYCVLKIDGLHTCSKNVVVNQAKPCWKKASEEQKNRFKMKLEDNLKGLNTYEIYKECNDVQCAKDSHNEANDDFTIGLLQCLDNAASECLPNSVGSNVKGNEKKSSVVMWKENIQPFKDRSMFWHAIWISAGKPINTQLHKLMKRARNIYHLQIRRSKKMKDILMKNSLLKACKHKNGDIFTEIRKMRMSCPTIASAIDGESHDVPNHFANIYSDLYNSVKDQGEFKDLQLAVNKQIDISSVIEVNKVTPSLVAEAVSHLRSCKSDPVFKFCSGCIKNAPLLFYEHLASLFRSYLMHGHISSVLLLSTLIPLLKNKLGNVCVSENYRSIAISSLILKVFDWVIILLYGDKLELDHLQFGYQKNVSTNMCTWMAVETIDYFMNNGSEVFICTMDMSKAFDNVKHSTLFQKLLNRDIPKIYLRLLMRMYSQQSANVRWNNVKSRQFPISNGVKQGAVLSAILYCVYVNDLYQLLRKKRYGCWIDGEYAGILGYSDDILLLAPSTNAPNEMVNTCESYAKDDNLRFSTHVAKAKPNV